MNTLLSFWSGPYSKIDRRAARQGLRPPGRRSGKHHRRRQQVMTWERKTGAIFMALIGILRMVSVE